MKDKVLIVDDSELNREFLSDILEDDYELLLSENGFDALIQMKNNLNDIALVLLDLVMPEMDGFKVLSYMKKYNWIQDIPVVIISSDFSAENIEKAYELGAEDFINRPFNVSIVKRRVSNLITLYAKQKKLKNIVTQQIYEKEKRSNLMISILSHIVEFRNGESGLHVLHINNITEKLLHSLVRNHEDIRLSSSEIALIRTASSLHDIGKISIPTEILNKPGRLTQEEFEIMKTHSQIGSDMLSSLKLGKKDPLIQVSYEICRWHHERWDGRGYPDGLKGDEIPLSAQVVSLADVYDALTSERCYKKAIPHEEAMQMILDGKCGAFNPKLLAALIDIEDDLKEETYKYVPSDAASEVDDAVKVLQNYDELSVTNQMMEQLEIEQKKISFFTDKLSNITFVYNANLDMIFFSKKDALRLNAPEVVLNPLSNKGIISEEHKKALEEFIELAKNTTCEKPDFEFECNLTIDGEEKICHCICRTMWLMKTKAEFAGVVGIINQERNVEDKQQVFSINGVNTKEEYYKMSFAQARTMVEELKKVFDVVRFVDVETNKIISIDEKNNIHTSPYSCYSLWERTGKCQNCTSHKAKASKSSTTKFEYVNNEFYYVISEYMEVDGNPYVLELVSKIKENFEVALYGKTNMSQTIEDLQKKLYTDELTGVYNRRYLEDRMYRDKNICAVAMVDLDYFKNVNDKYGHFVGDVILSETSKVMLESVRSKDMVIRYGGDEFIIMFSEISRSIVEMRLNQIRLNIQNTLLKNTGIERTCSIGCAFGSCSVEYLLQEADKMLYEAKKTRNRVSVWFEGDEEDDNKRVL
ncbi:diguanylate cyclase [Amedibacterium intestinale]|uniref:diguanylate cyclase n=1 Tax=Amedibacterium intestinale TaxID=2583452 RepID=UPI000E4A1BCE|nr:diguanylate cyclase [Amedibacterium intestinale]RHO22098.1 diguanylate cyclase [Eubacterium sp. AM18-26]RHO26725.1 diguanylate cyclase [Eubacterium sp. AM18-10LB-B]